MAKLKLPDS